jgi:alpha-glucosidase
MRIPAFVAASSLLAAGAATRATAAGPPPAYRLLSPNGRIAVDLSAGARLSYDVLLDGKPLLRGATMSMDVDQVRLGADPRVTATRRQSVDHRVEPAVRQKAAVLVDRYNELRVECAGGYAVAFRAYDQGVAYRFETSLPAAEVKVRGEEAVFRFAGDAGTGVYYPREDGFFSHNERQFRRVRMGDVGPSALATIPAVVDLQAGPKIAIAESDVDDYPGLWLRGTGGPALVAVFPPYPLQEKLSKDRDLRVTRAADYIAVTRGTRTFPWRILAVAEADRDLAASTLTYLLARPSEIQDTSWIRPGKVAWDWWNALGLRDVAFTPGVNTQTYKAYVDFAARYGIEYIVLDEGWYPLGNLLQVVPDLDMQGLVAYARQKNVGVILWVVWKTLDDQLQPALDQFARWGIKGLKIDFIQRDDQPVMRFLTRVCRELARRQMLIDFHGGIRAALLTRTWPNVLTVEGVRGMEHLKWGRASDPEHNVTLPFTRMLLGPMDYTPGAMINAAQDSFTVNFKQPMSLGTRCHQLAMYVVYESPLQMLADTPSNYLREPEAMELLGPVPTVWDETRVLDGRIGDYVVIARRKGRDWYIGAMTDWTERRLEVDLSFLPEDARAETGAYQMTSFQDGPDAASRAGDYRKTTMAVGHATRVTFRLAPGGGWAAHIRAR